MSYVRTRLGRFFYEERGSLKRPGDKTIVLLHGLLFDSGMWRGQLDELARFGRVITIDGPGHGKTEPPPRFTLEEHADALYDAFGELKTGPVVLAGLSWGGMVGMRLALQHAGSVSAMALLDTSAEAQPFPQRIRNRLFVSMHRRVGMPYSLFMKEVAPEMFSRRTLAERPDIVEAAYRRTSGFDREGVAKAALAVVVHRSNVLPQLGRLRVPTLVMCGTEDRSTPPVKAENIAKAIPGARIVMLDGLGHMSVVEDSAAVNVHLIPFLRDAATSEAPMQRHA